MTAPVRLTLGTHALRTQHLHRAEALLDAGAAVSASALTDRNGAENVGGSVHA